MRIIKKAKNYEISPDEKYFVFSDGSYRLNRISHKYVMGVGVDILNSSGERVLLYAEEFAKHEIPYGFNDRQFEEIAIINALKICRNLGIQHVVIQNDSSSVVDYVNKLLDIKILRKSDISIPKRFEHIYQMMWEEVQSFKNVFVEKIPRSQNYSADYLTRAIEIINSEKFHHRTVQKLSKYGNLLYVDENNHKVKHVHETLKSNTLFDEIKMNLITKDIPDTTLKSKKKTIKNNSENTPINNSNLFKFFDYSFQNGKPKFQPAVTQDLIWIKDTTKGGKSFFDVVVNYRDLNGNFVKANNKHVQISYTDENKSQALLFCLCYFIIEHHSMELLLPADFEEHTQKSKKVFDILPIDYNDRLWQYFDISNFDKNSLNKKILCLDAMTRKLFDKSLFINFSSFISPEYLDKFNDVLKSNLQLSVGYTRNENFVNGNIEAEIERDKKRQEEALIIKNEKNLLKQAEREEIKKTREIKQKDPGLFHIAFAPPVRQLQNISDSSFFNMLN